MLGSGVQAVSKCNVSPVSQDCIQGHLCSHACRLSQNHNLCYFPIYCHQLDGFALVSAWASILHPHHHDGRKLVGGNCSAKGSLERNKAPAEDPSAKPVPVKKPAAKLLPYCTL